jgi:hypothetical protein
VRGLNRAGYLGQQPQDLARGEGLDTSPGIQGQAVHPVHDEEREAGCLRTRPLAGVMKPGHIRMLDAREQFHFQREASVSGLACELQSEGARLGLSRARCSEDPAVRALRGEGEQTP